MTLGQRIQELRKQNNLSQEALGEKLEVHWNMTLAANIIFPVGDGRSGPRSGQAYRYVPPFSPHCGPIIGRRSSRSYS